MEVDLAAYAASLSSLQMLAEFLLVAGCSGPMGRRPDRQLPFHQGEALKPGFSVEVRRADESRAAFFTEKPRTRPCPAQRGRKSRAAGGRWPKAVQALTMQMGNNKKIFYPQFC